MSKVLRSGGTVTVSPPVFTRMSAAVAAQLETISTGLSTNLLPTNHYQSGVTPLSTSAAATGIGWKEEDPNSDPATLIDDPDTLNGSGKATVFRLPAGVYLPIVSVTRELNPIVTITGDFADFVANFWYVHCPVDPGQPCYTIKNWTGTNVTSDLNLSEIGGGITSATTMRLGTHVLHGGSTYCCIQNHQSSDATTEPGVGASWSSYWTLVTDLIYTPNAWSDFNRSYRTVDSTAWPTSPASGDAMLAFSAGIGNGLLSSVPGPERPAAFGDVHYAYSRQKVNAAYTNNDGAGGQKLTSYQWSVPGGYSGWLHQPAWGVGGATPTAGDDDGPVGAASYRFDVDYWDGNDYSGVPTSTVPFLLKATQARDTYMVCETIFLHAAARGDLSEEWTFIDGVLVKHLFVRTVSANGTRLAFRGLTVLQDTTWGGGGSFPPVENQNIIDELYLACGVARSGAQADHFASWCEEGDTPPAGSTFHIIFELRDANDARIDCGTDWNPGLGRQCLAFTTSSGTAAKVNSGGDLGGSSVDVTGSGRIRIQVSGASAGAVTVTASLAEVANNDKLTGRTFDGSKAVTLT